ncbi:MAG: CHRD domain-containing protein, partial [Verrucomicrobiales bacterium]|nr:CHRD domain-containing protein [Verrucomicrobiales bacterium]
MNKLLNPKSLVGALVLFAFGLVSAIAQPTGQWDFDGGNLTATVGQALQYVDGANGPTEQGTQFGSTTSFGIPDVGGAPAQVMKFPGGTAGTGYSMPTPLSPNGGGSLVNNWTLVLDVLFPAASDAKLRALLETDLGLIDADAEFFVNADNGVGNKGQSFGKILPDTWHRVGFVVDGEGGTIRIYLDGVEVGVRNIANLLDGRFAFTPGSTAQLFADDTGETATGYVNSIQLRNVALGKDQMRALAGPVAAGVPQTLPPIPSGVEQWIPPGEFASRNTAVGAIITTGSTTIENSSISLKLNGQAVANPGITRDGGLITVLSAAQTLTPGTKYTVELTYTDSLAGVKTLTREFAAALFYEDFEGLTLLPRKDESNAATEPFEKAWTHTPPAGWSIDNSQFPATVITAENPDEDADGFADLDGRSEWAGWSFANKDFWIAADNQTRDQFSLGQGTVAVADNDEWDDQTHAISLFNSFLKTPEISLAGIAPNTAFLKFASSWRPEALDDPNANSFPVGPNGEAVNNQTAIITASYDGAAPVQVFKYDSVNGSPTYKPDAQNESVLVQLNNPAGAQKLVLSFEMRDAANDWWWAVDNVAISAGAAPPLITQQPASTEVNEGTAASLSVTATGDGLSYQWFKGQGSGKTAVAGATGAALNFPAVKIEDGGYYSVEIKNSIGTTSSNTAKLTVLPTTAGRLVLLEENFDGLSLGASVDVGTGDVGGTPGTAVWTKTAPTGWSTDDTGVPGVGDPDQDGVTEWAGWSFAAPSFWTTDGGQSRDQFKKGTGVIAIADSDEWDDIGHAAGNMATYLKTKPIPLQNAKPNSVIVKFDSSWRPEEPQKANITVAFDNGAPVEIIRLESAPASPNFRPDELNETIALRVNNPAGAQNMVVTFGYFDTRNNWWWAIDNLQVLAEKGALFFEDFEGIALGPNKDETSVGANVWSPRPPQGWAVDNSQFPATIISPTNPDANVDGFADNDGATEWAGWGFANKDWWVSAVGDQTRSQFTKGTGTVAIADPDEWDDLPHAVSLFNSVLKTPSIPVTGAAANSLFLSFDSSWRPEATDDSDAAKFPVGPNGEAINNQTALITVSYDGRPAVQVLKWDSVAGSPTFHPDSQNESVRIPLNNPAGVSGMVINFALLEGANDWWWAIDNVEVSADEAAAAQIRFTSVTAAGNAVKMDWTGGDGPFLVQGAIDVVGPWLDLVTTTDRTTTQPLLTPTGFFRIVDKTTKSVKQYRAVLTGAAEKPNPVNTPAIGMANVSIEADKVTYVVVYSGLTGPATAGHFHGPAGANETAGVMLPFVPLTPLGPAGAFVAVAVPMTDIVKTAMETGKAYANIHTAANGGGEIRGQVIPASFHVTLSGAAERPNPVTTT